MAVRPLARQVQGKGMPLLRLLNLSVASLLFLACEPAPSERLPVSAAPVTTAPVTTAPAGPSAEEHYARALELDAAGHSTEAAAAAELAVAAGAGRDARLLAAKLAILRDDLAAADRLLQPLAAEEPQLASARYNLGLVAHRRGEYNLARGEYLAALQADSRHAAARYNLALLTWDAGVTEEAQHHARKFLELAPGDPRGARLQARVALADEPRREG